MGWASGMRAGIAIGEAFNKGRQQQAYEEIQAQKPEELQGYTTDDAAQLEAAARTGLYDIIPQYAEPTPQQRDPNRMNPVEFERNMTQDPRGVFTGYKVVPKAQMFQGQPVEQPEAGLVAPSRVTDFLGQRYAGELPENRQVGLRSRALAEATTDPVERQRLLADAIKQEREAVLAAREDELYPLKLKGAQLDVRAKEQGIEDTDLSLEQKKRQEKERLNMASYQEAVNALPEEQQNDPRALMALATKFKLTTKQQDQLIADKTNRSTNEITLARTQIQKLVSGKNLDQLSELHKTNDALDPGRHFKVLRDSKGGVVLQMVDSKTGDPIGAPAFSGTEAQATAYLYKAATSPESLVEFAASMEKAALDRQKTEAEITYKGQLGQAAITNADAAKANATSTENYRRTQGLQKFVNANGETVILDIGKLPVRDDGTVAIPQGLRPATEKVEPSEAVVQKLAENLFGTPIPGGGMGKDGKPRLYTASEAYAEAYRTAFEARNPGSKRRAPKTAADLLAEEIELRRQAGPRGGPNAVGIDGTQRRMQTRPFEPNQDF